VAECERSSAARRGGGGCGLGSGEGGNGIRVRAAGGGGAYIRRGLLPGQTFSPGRAGTGRRTEVAAHGPTRLPGRAARSPVTPDRAVTRTGPPADGPNGQL
jgi:hypothetical protein